MASIGEPIISWTNPCSNLRVSYPESPISRVSQPEQKTRQQNLDPPPSSLPSLWFRSRLKKGLQIWPQPLKCHAIFFVKRSYVMSAKMCEWGVCSNVCSSTFMSCRWEEREREKRQGDCATKSRKNMVKRDGGSTVTTQRQHNTENVETGFWASSREYRNAI